MREAVRVALLARPGAGADRLRDALQATGAELVLDADPTTLAPERLAGAGADSVVVLLDAAVEEALDRLDAVLHDPAMDVLYEESAVAAAREGWDVARWTRHLSAKLMRHGDVLPPGRESDDAPTPVTIERTSAPEPPAAPMFDPVAAEYDAPAPSPGPEDDMSLDFPGQAGTAPESNAADPTPPRASDPASDAPPAGGGAIRDFRRDLADIEQRIASMGLVADERPAPDATDDAAPAEPDAPPPAPATAPGAVLVFAGIGGPDAVRQFLGALPAAFSRPVLVHQRLDGGRHDRLVQQMARATTLPVQLAVEDQPLAPGHVYILPPGLHASDDGGALRFAAGDDPMASLPAAESAVLMFSGSDIAIVDAAMRHAQAGALVAGQSPEDCYDAAAADALVARGAHSGQPAELARRIAERWAT